VISRFEAVQHLLAMIAQEERSRPAEAQQRQ
jgi:hypothetical protein